MSRPIICEGLHFTGMWNTIAKLQHCKQREVRAHTTSLASSYFIEASVPNLQSKRSLYVV